MFFSLFFVFFVLWGIGMDSSHNRQDAGVVEGVYRGLYLRALVFRFFVCYLLGSALGLLWFVLGQARSSSVAFS